MREWNRLPRLGVAGTCRTPCFTGNHGSFRHSFQGESARRDPVRGEEPRRGGLAGKDFRPVGAGGIASGRQLRADGGKGGLVAAGQHAAGIPARIVHVHLDAGKQFGNVPDFVGDEGGGAQGSPGRRRGPLPGYRVLPG